MRAHRGDGAMGRDRTTCMDTHQMDVAVRTVSPRLGQSLTSFRQVDSGKCRVLTQGVGRCASAGMRSQDAREPARAADIRGRGGSGAQNFTAWSAVGIDARSRLNAPSVPTSARCVKGHSPSHEWNLGTCPSLREWISNGWRGSEVPCAGIDIQRGTVSLYNARLPDATLRAVQLPKKVSHSLFIQLRPTYRMRRGLRDTRRPRALIAPVANPCLSQPRSTRREKGL